MSNYKRSARPMSTLQFKYYKINRPKMVGAEGFEPPTSCSQSRRATRLRYAPFLKKYKCQKSNYK